MHAIEEAEEDFYRAGWRATTCRNLLEKYAPPDEVTGSGFAINMGLFTSAFLDSGNSFLKRRELFRQGYAGDDAPEFDRLLKAFCSDEYQKLTAFAARLGHESAQFQWHTRLYIFYRHEGSSEYLEALQQENPLLWHYRHTLTRLGLEVEERARHAVIAEKLARAQGRVVDVSHVFTYSPWREFTYEKQERVRAQGLEEFRRLYGDLKPQ